MNVFFREMKAQRKSLLIWCIAMLFVVASGMGKYVAMSGTGQSINDLMSEFPKSLQHFFGFASMDLTTAVGFYGVLFLYLVLMATIQAGMMGANIIAKEERDKTAEFLFVKPISRTRVIVAKLCAALLNVIILNLFTLLVSIGMVSKYNKGESVTGEVLNLMLAMFILQLVFLFIGTGIAAVSKNPKVATSVASAVLLVSFILSMAIDMNDRLAGLKYFTPFQYYTAKNLLNGPGFEPIFLILSGVLVAGFLVLTFMSYKDRDLHV